MPPKRSDGKAAADGATASESRFVGKRDLLEDSLQVETVGLVRLEDFQRKREQLVEEEALAEKREQRREKSRKARAKLSFADDDDEDAATPQPKRAKVAAKDPGVDTSFLPDRERDEAEQRMRQELRTSWTEEQEKRKQEPMTVAYAYWDGSGHPNTVACTKGDTVGAFLAKCRDQVPALRRTSTDALMYINDDVILPHTATFHELLVSKARGKSRILFSDTPDDDDPPGKVVDRAWYTRNKHIFPANGWVVRDSTAAHTDPPRPAPAP